MSLLIHKAVVRDLSYLAKFMASLGYYLWDVNVNCMRVYKYDKAMVGDQGQGRVCKYLLIQCTSTVQISYPAIKP